MNSPKRWLVDNAFMLRMGSAFWMKKSWLLLPSSNTASLWQKKNFAILFYMLKMDRFQYRESNGINTSFWRFWNCSQHFGRVIAPELIEMRVPRNLMPFVLPDMKNAPDGIKVTTTSDTENMKNAPDSIKVTTSSDNGNMTNAPDSINVTTTLNTGNEYNCSHTKNEVAVADCLVNALRTSVPACPSLYTVKMKINPWFTV